MIKTLIAYTTKHGTTRLTAGYIAEFLGNEVEMCDIRKNRPNLDDYDRIIIGASIHASKIQKRMKRFLRKNKDTLLKKELGLYLCCMYTGETAQTQFIENYPEELRNHAKSSAIVGGAFDFEEMNIMERAIVKKVANIETSVNKIDRNEIKQFVTQLEKKIDGE